MVNAGRGAGPWRATPTGLLQNGRGVLLCPGPSSGISSTKAAYVIERHPRASQPVLYAMCACVHQPAASGRTPELHLPAACGSRVVAHPAPSLRCQPGLLRARTTWRALRGPGKAGLPCRPGAPWSWKGAVRSQNNKCVVTEEWLTTLGYIQDHDEILHGHNQE